MSMCWTTWHQALLLIQNDLHCSSHNRSFLNDLHLPRTAHVDYSKFPAQFSMPYSTIWGLFTIPNYTLDFLTPWFCLLSSLSFSSTLLKSYPSLNASISASSWSILMPTTAMKSQCLLQSELISQSYVCLYHPCLLLSCTNYYILPQI